MMEYWGAGILGDVGVKPNLMKVLLMRNRIDDIRYLYPKNQFSTISLLNSGVWQPGG
jgi:hypothetical protein